MRVVHKHKIVELIFIDNFLRKYNLSLQYHLPMISTYITSDGLLIAYMIFIPRASGFASPCRCASASAPPFDNMFVQPSLDRAVTFARVFHSHDSLYFGHALAATA